MPTLDPTLRNRLIDTTDDAPADRLAALILGDLFARPVSALVDTRSLAVLVRDAVARAVLADPGFRRVVATVHEEIARIGEAHTLGALVPAEMQTVVREVAARPFTPDRRLVLALIDREPLRGMIRTLLVEQLGEFGRKMRAPVADNAVAKGLGGLGRMAAEQARSRTGALGQFASSAFGAVSHEVEKQVEKRTQEFADVALASVIGRIADQLSHPKAAPQQAELRAALFGAVMALHGVDVAREIEKAEPRELLAIVRRGVAAWIERDDAVDAIEARIAVVIAPHRDRTLGDVLDEFGVREVLSDGVRPWLRDRLVALFGTEGFATWFAALLASVPAPSR